MEETTFNGHTMRALHRRKFLSTIGLAMLAPTIAACGGGGRNTSNTPAPPDGSPPNPQPVPSGLLSQVGITVMDIKVGTIGPNFMGLSYEKSTASGALFSASNADLIGLLRALGPGILRIGGNSVDRTAWNRNGAGLIPGEMSPTDITRLAGFVDACGWQVLYGVNLGQSTPSAAADEVSYAARLFGAALAGVEIGNEPDLYVNRGYFTQSNWGATAFISRWHSFATAIRQAQPGVVLSGPTLALPKNIASWAVPFMTSERSNIGLVTQHYYRSNGPNPGSTISDLLSPDTYLTTILGDLKGAGGSLPYRLSETNSYFSGGTPGVSNSCASALWVIDHLFANAQSGAAGVNLHGGGHSDGYTPIADQGGNVVEVRPEYYGLFFFHLLGPGGVYQTKIAADSSLNVSAYAVKSTTGSLTVAIVNKDSSNTLNLTIDCGMQPRAASFMALRLPSLSATSGIQWQGGTISLGGKVAPQAAYTLTANGSNVMAYVPPATAALIRIS